MKGDGPLLHSRVMAGSAFTALSAIPPAPRHRPALCPRWHAFILTGVLAGLRWGESAALRVSDIDFTRGRIRVERPWSAKAGRIEAPKGP